jgi:membrane associated rhomboid family serine protease
VVEQQELEFLHAFRTRRTVISYSLFAFNILVFLLMSLAGGSQNLDTLLGFGAKHNVAIDSGETWRFVTPIFLHIGFLHLAFNSYALWIVGPQVEKLYGGPRFLLLYLITGVAGVAASYFYNPYIPSAGASGAIFGLFGVLLVFSFKYRKSVPAFFSNALGSGILLTLGINLVIGWTFEHVDVAAHLGGLIAGCALGAVIPFARPGEPERPVFKVLQAAFIAVIAVSFFQVATHYGGPSVSIRNMMSSRASLGEFAGAIQKGQEAFETSEMVLDMEDFRKLPQVREDLGRAIGGLQGAPSFSGRAGTLRRDLLDVLQKQFAYVEEVERTGRARTDFIGASPQTSRYSRLKLRIADWFENEARGYRNVR